MAHIKNRIDERITLTWANKIKEQLNKTWIADDIRLTWAEHPDVRKFIKPILDYAADEEKRINKAFNIDTP
jgi:hypothetical protein